MDQLYSSQYFLVAIQNHPALLPPQLAIEISLHSDVNFLPIQ
jgi:hypothetical protein